MDTDREYESRTGNGPGHSGSHHETSSQQDRSQEASESPHVPSFSSKPPGQRDDRGTNEDLLGLGSWKRHGLGLRPPQRKRCRQSSLTTERDSARRGEDRAAAKSTRLPTLQPKI